MGEDEHDADSGEVASRDAGDRSRPVRSLEDPTFLAGLRTSGLVAPLVVYGAIKGDLFVAYVQKHLAPTLRRGDVVVLGNLSSHKRIEAREAIEAAGAELRFLPPYSPDVNPIELAFSKLKRELRDAAERSIESLWRRCGALLERFAPDECRNYLRHCGYHYG